ncbi:sporulation histidine kinase inhibitor Sda [Paenibacillus alba]|uniref:Sporulation histidine kinase inhibitor Sda n=2 Tax=Paenibacillus alba TaxID=1197127 RepID=A0ABU6FZH2_9BACL|nr:sporulation histidine kinase inhibitor Sda [Paenibacillus alba]
MKSLSSQRLIDAYFSSIDLKLEKEFIQLLLLEIKKRNINIDKLPPCTLKSDINFEGERE